MNGTLKFLTFLFTLPPLGVLAHDLYIIYGNEEEKVEKLKNLQIDPDHFTLSDVGRLWMGYAPDSLNTVRDSISLNTWQSFLAPLLEQNAMLVAAIPLILLLLITGIMWVLGLGPFTRSEFSGKKEAGMGVATFDRDKAQHRKYGRK